MYVRVCVWGSFSVRECECVFLYSWFCDFVLLFLPFPVCEFSCVSVSVNEVTVYVPCLDVPMIILRITIILKSKMIRIS